VGVTSDPAPQTGPTYNPGGTVNPGGAGTAPTWQDFFNAAAGYIGGGNASTSAGGTGAAASSSQTGTHFGVPHLGIRLIAGTIGVGILLIVAARLVFRD
jgi:hypothetical protein